MADLGQFNNLRVAKETDLGVFLEGGAFGEILLPKKYVAETTKVGDQLDVFLYNDSEDRIIATTQNPKAVVGECAYLKAVATSKFGAFMDWGLPKDLLVPFSEQQKPIHKGYSYAVYLYVDESTQRIAASTRLEDHLHQTNPHFREKQTVDCLIYGRSDLGFKAIVNGSHLGQFFESETFRPLHYGERIKAYIKQVRSDGKIDLMLQLPSHLERNQLGNAIIQHLKDNQGRSTLTDRSPPDDIYQAFGVSKASYKKALGQLYKSRLILIEKHQVTLI
ncbi:MAG: S1-like domain-containing RNA-binding protein [Pseudomonadota bacterium]